MDLEEHHDLIFGEEFCFPDTRAYYPPLYGPTGINMPADLYQQQTIPRCGGQGLHYTGHQAQGTSCMCYVVPDYGFAHSPHGPQPWHPRFMTDGRFVGTQECRAETVERTYHQPVPTSPYAVLPSAADRNPASTTQSLAYTNGLFVPSGSGQTVAVPPERSAAWNPSLQSASVSSMKFQDHRLLPKEQLCRPASWKTQLLGGAIAPARLPCVRQVPQQSPQVEARMQPSIQANLSYSNDASNARSGHCMMSAERSQPYAKASSYVKSLSSSSQQNISKAKKPISLMSSEIIVKSYTSRLHIGNPEGKIIIRTDQYNRDDFQVVYPNAKFFVIKSYNEGDVHKSIKYGVWSTSFSGNQKLDTAFREAQAIAASSSTLCPVFLFFSVNGCFHFCGVAEMVGPVDYQNSMDFWCTDKWTGCFPVKWHIIKNVRNTTFRSILLQNNEDKPVTSSRDTQEVHYTPGTTMLELFKYTRAEECLLDEFMIHEEEEAARSRQRKRCKLRRSAPHFIPAWHGHRTHKPVQPKSDNVLMDRIISETNNLTDKLHNLNLDRHQGSWHNVGNLISEASTANTQKESRSHGKKGYGKKARQSVEKAITKQGDQPLTPSVNSATDGEQQLWKKIEVTPTEKAQPETAASTSSETSPDEQQNEGTDALVCSALGAPEMTREEEKIGGKSCSLAVNCETSEACSKALPGVVAIGSMLVQIAKSS